MARIVEGTVKRLLGGLAAALVWLPVSARSAECPVRAPTDLVSPGKLVVATHLTTPPQGFLDDDKPAGFAIEIGEAIPPPKCPKGGLVEIPLPGMFPRPKA